MTIQQVSGSSSNGIMNFLFQDDGSGEGTVLDGADFSRTLHQLLGEFSDGEAPATDSGTALTQEATLAATDAEAAKALVAATPTEADAAPALSADLDALITDFTLPAHGAKVPGAAQLSDADSHELTTPFWHSAAFADATQHAVVPLDITQIRDPAAHAESAPDTTAYATPAANDASFTGPAPAFNKGIDHVVALARQSDAASAELAQQAATPPAPEGRSRPASGKFLPLTFRQPAVAGAQGKAVASQAGPIGLPAATETGMLPGIETANFFSEALAAESHTQQPAGQQASALTQGIQGPRNETALPTLPKALAAEAPANPMPQFNSPYIAGTEAWLQDLGTRVEWLKDQDMTKAELQLHPAELGALEIQITTVDDATTVSFVTHNAAAREIIEDSMPRLREMLASQGMQLGESHVSQQSAEGRRGDAGTGASPNGQQQNGGDDGDAAPQRRSAYVADPSRIDHYV